ncbi:MAG: hypothetical protein WBM83_05720, partial [Flavobacteriaceae bacterium]
LQNGDLPGIPNWLGGIVLPFFTWFLLYRIHKRIDKSEISVASESLRAVILRFLAAALVAISIAVFFVNDIDAIDYVMGSIFILAFFIPLYKSEYLLGWVLGSAFTFGAIIPIGFGSIFALILYLFFQLREFVLSFFKKRK